MALEDTSRQINALNSRAANYSASNEGSQVVHDTNEAIIKSAELAAAWRTLGLTDDEGMALVARQQKLNPALSEADVQLSVITSAQSLYDPELRDDAGNKMPMAEPIRSERYLDPNKVVEYGQDEADLQLLSADEQLEGRETDLRKKANAAIEARVLDQERGVRKEREKAFQRRLNGPAKFNDGTAQGYAPQRVLERRIAPQDRLDTGGGQTRATGSGASAGDKALQDAFYKMSAAMEADPALMTPENLEFFDRLEGMAFPQRERRNQREEARNLSAEFDASLNAEIQARNAAKTLTPQESLILESQTRGLERMGEIQIKKTGPGKDMVTEIPRSMIQALSLPEATLGADGAYYDRPNGNPLSVQGPERSPITAQDGIGGLIYDNLYATDSSGKYPQVGINQSINLLQHRLATKIPSKWGTLQGAPTTIRGFDELDQALQSVLSLAATNKKALVEMPDAGATGKPQVSKNPGGLEALKAIGYNRPEAVGLLNAVAQLQMHANNQVGPEAQGTTAANVPIRFNSPEQMGDFQVDHIVGPVDNPQVRGLFRGLTGDAIQTDFDDPVYTTERVLSMAQQNFSGEVLRTNPTTGEISNSKPPIGGVSGNKNYMYNKLGIRNLDDLRYALEQQSLRRDARIKREPGDPVRRQVGTVSDGAERNIIRSLLATERANRDERTPKALPASGQSYGSLQDAFLAEQGRRGEGIRLMRQEAARVAQGQPSGRKPLGPGEWVRASDGNVRVMGNGGIPFNRDAAIAVNNPSTQSTSRPNVAAATDPWTETPGTGAGTTASTPRPSEQTYQAPTSGPAQGPVPGSARKQFSDRANYARKSPRYQTARRVGYGVGGGVTGLLGLDALIGNESDNRRELEAQY